MNNNALFNASMIIKSTLCKMATECSPGDKDEEKLVPRLLRDHVKFPHPGTWENVKFLIFPHPREGKLSQIPRVCPPPPPGLNIDKCIRAKLRCYQLKYLYILVLQC
jgi:hypothetical protein